MLSRGRKMIKRMIGLALSLLLLTALPLPALALLPEQKTVRVGYVDALSYEEMRADGYKSGAGYEYLQKISYLTGWKYEYVYGTFQECLEMLEKGEIDLFGNLTYTPERAEHINFALYPQGREVYCLYTDEHHPALELGGIEALSGCRIGVTGGSYQSGILDAWLRDNRVKAQIVPYSGYNALMDALRGGSVDAIVTPDLSIAYGCIALEDIGASDYYFGVSKNRPDLLKELNSAQRELQLNEFDYNGALSRKYHSQTSSAQELSEREKIWLGQRDYRIAVGFMSNNLPYSAKNEDGTVSGILSVLGDTMEQELGIRVEERFYPSSARLLEALRQGEVDAIGPVYGDLYLAEQKDYVLTNALLKATPIMLYTQGNFDQAPSTIAVSDETLVTEDVVQILYPGVNMLSCDSMEDCLNAVAEGKASGTVVSSVRLNMLRQYPAMDKLQFTDLPMEVEVCLATTKGNRMAAAVLNTGIALSTASLNGSMLAQSSYVAPRVTLRDFAREYMTPVLLLCAFVTFLFAAMALQLSYKQKRLNLALGEAKKANEAKTAFLGTMSHDIRTPLNAIIGLTEMAQKEEDVTTIQGYLSKVSSSGKFMLSLINDILDVSKIENGSLKLCPEPYTKQEFQSSIDTVIRPLMEQRHVNFVCDLSQGPECILVDGLRFNQIFQNLLSNASKFTPEDGQVSLILENRSSDEKTADLRFYVRDNGVGMSPEFLKHLYDPFSQEKSSLSGHTKGTGLGLAIVKKLVDAMGGTITVKSNLGLGSEFCIDLRLPIAQLPQKNPAEDQRHGSLRGMKLLLVEDNEMNTYVAKVILEEVGCLVTTAADGKEALDIFSSSIPGTFDAILMDVRMPVMDGIEATKAIRRLPRRDAARIPIIAMTADAFAEEQKRTRDAGMNAHIAKPIDTTLLYAVLEQYSPLKAS